MTFLLFIFLVHFLVAEKFFHFRCLLLFRHTNNNKSVAQQCDSRKYLILFQFWKRTNSIDANERQRKLHPAFMLRSHKKCRHGLLL